MKSGVKKRIPRRGDFIPQVLNFSVLWSPLILFLFLSLPNLSVPWTEVTEQSQSSCNRTRRIIANSSWGIISDGKANYTQDSYCEWLIVGEPNQYITLEIHQVRTECSYDYLFVFDGESYTRNSTLLASFSGASEHSVTLMARSGKMLILLYSDTNYALEGFQAEFFITRCPLNCSESRKGGKCIRILSDEESPIEDPSEIHYKCECEPSRSGEGCEIHNKDVDTLLLPSRTFPNLFHRVGHSVTQIHDKVYIFGGFDLNKILNDLKIYDLRTAVIHDFNPVPSSTSSDGASSPDSENELKPTDFIWPQGRFGHAAAGYKSGFFIHGGRLSDGNGISDQLLYFNVTSLKWTVVSVGLPRLMYHTMTAAGTTGEIYVYGGGSPSGEFSSKLYRFHGDRSMKSAWEEVKAFCCGKPKDRSVLGHSAAYWKDKHAIVIYGGVTIDMGRFSKISSQMWMYLIDSNVWVEVQYRRNHHYKMLLKMNSNMNPVSHNHAHERAFHSMDIVGNQVLIIGGYTHSHNRDETCYSNQMLVYNLECQQFVPDLPLRISGIGIDPGHTMSIGHRIQGVFGHRTIVHGDKVFIIGGYRGYLDGRIRSITLPFKMKKGYEDEGCHNYENVRHCSSDPHCGWCPTDAKCYDKLTGSKNCTTNLQTSQCPGICPLMSNCHSCVSMGCTWCDSAELCLDHSHDPRQCNARPMSTDYKSCLLNYDRQGVTLFEFRHPADFQNPDYVRVVNSTTFKIQRDNSPSVGSGTTFVDHGPTIMVMKGFVMGTLQVPRRIELCGSQARVNLSMDNEKDNNNMNLHSKTTDTEILTTHLNWSGHLYCMNLTWPSGHPVLLQPETRIRFEVSANTSRAQVNTPVRVILQQRMLAKNGSTTSVPLTPYRIPKENLVPWAGVNISCPSYSTCLSCVGDSSCSWQVDENVCLNREISSQMPEKFLRSTAMILTPDECPMCGDRTNCQDCVQDPQKCEWWEEESACHRRGRSDTAVRVPGACPTDCNLRKNCSSCLEGPGKCVWCADRQECFVFDVYTSFYQYGQCVHWMDKGEQCQRCAKQSSCDDCIRFLGCGWNYDENGGSCTEGDFKGPLRTDDIAIMATGGQMESSSSPFKPNKTWTYATCPDIDECQLQIHDCHENATCENTAGSYVCKCKQGFTGDGKKQCEETCFEPCVHGTCSSSFICECDLGWTGVDCSIDCGCNNHSSCETGKCDKCQDWTQGSSCQACIRGSYGNATVAGVGCSPCECNGHGDDSLGTCDIQTGECYCLNNTSGPNCSKCQPGYFGNPRHGLPCYRTCSGRALMESTVGYFGLNPFYKENSYINDDTSYYLYTRHIHRFSSSYLPLENRNVEHCVWILRLPPSEEQQGKSRKIRISISPGYIIPCAENALNIYSGVPSFTKTRKDSVLIASVCTPEDSVAREGRIIVIATESNVATMILRAVIRNSTINFNASFEFLKDSEPVVVPSSSAASAASAAYASIITFPMANSKVFVTRLYDGQSVFSRFGHSLHADEKNVWIFGGYSLSHGALNDVRQFSRDIGKWIPLTILVVNSNEDSVPPARYFHAGILIPTTDNIVIHGGVAQNMSFLADTWRFDTRISRWTRVTKSSVRLAGHTITLRATSVSKSSSSTEAQEDGLSGSEMELVMIGGFNPDSGFSNLTLSLKLNQDVAHWEWEPMITTGASPIGIYGHSTVYHPATDTFYVYGGVLYDSGKIFVSSQLFALHWPSKRWTVLPPMEENQVARLPVPRFFHAAVTTESYMVVMGGTGGSHNSSVFAYNYKCNLWTLLEGESTLLDRTGGAASISGEDVLLMGGWDWEGATTSESLFKVTLPKDICSMQSSGERCKATLGCSYCFSNNNQSQQCYNAELVMPKECSMRPNDTELKIDFKGGKICSKQWLESRNCNEYLSCTECLSTWPSHPNAAPMCQWCTNCKIGRCIPIGKKCQEENSCSHKQREIVDVSLCPERTCSASECSKCVGAGKCAWTRQILRSNGWGWELKSKPVYDWVCFRKQSVNTSTASYKVVASPPEQCPPPCTSYRTCETCLSSNGGEGGFKECHWSITKNMCLSPAHSYLLCFGGICGPILSGDPQVCPKPCSSVGSCASCLQNPSCGWCSTSGRNGLGQCLPGDIVSSQAHNCSATSMTNGNDILSWNYMKCPAENECENGHHTCKEFSEKCIDLEDGYRCECQKGYREEANGACMPICEDGCIHGTCVSPGKCQCHFGYVGRNCSAQCNCNGHSDCAGVDDLNNCLECKNDTMGPQCSKCKPLFVGDPRNGRPCISCFDFCNGHSNICLPPTIASSVCNSNGRVFDESELIRRIRSNSSFISEGPADDAVCCACQEKTSGDKCDNCLPGYFRGSEDKRRACRKCECHGHGDSCDAVSGADCNCHNNTESDHCSQNLSKLGHTPCWKTQCAKCRETYFGNPVNGHQCYRHMFVDYEYCFDPKSQDYCTMKPKPLLSGRTVFFAVQPKFMNVNIRINLDVTHGSVHVYLSPKDDTFIIKPDGNTYMHQVKFDSKYGLGGEAEPVISHDDMAHNRDFPEQGSFNVSAAQDEDAINLSVSKINVGAVFRLVEEEAAGFATHITLEDPRAVLVVRNVRNRLVITLPQDYHDLRMTRFYIVLEGVGDVSFGSLSFRQDQLHIDLFVFFSVFFSAFFLFLAACGIAWKVKQNVETRQARHRHVAEMLSMAKRPFAIWTLLLEPEQSSPLYQAYSQCRKTCRKGCICIRPLAIENCQESSAGVCTMLVALPGGPTAPMRLCLASTLASLHHRSHPPLHVRRRRR